MLRINIPSTGSGQLTFSSFENENLPKPPNGIDEETGNVVMLFDDEEQAVNYADELEDVSSAIDDNESPLKLAINDIIVAIKSDEFVQSYLG
ncbi:MAG TPA: hypothetical protein VGC01_09530 [Mucilaginibacter sp.]